jgi:hypothetical protein
MYNLAKFAKVELKEPEMNAAAQAAGDDKVGTTIENRDFTFCGGSSPHRHQCRDGHPESPALPSADTRETAS